MRTLQVYGTTHGCEGCLTRLTSHKDSFFMIVDTEVRAVGTDNFNSCWPLSKFPKRFRRRRSLTTETVKRQAGSRPECIFGMEKDTGSPVERST
ncbi:hypothetical protein VP1G_11498 [Cytospora mali]|uniref:Uncharacterized protein n=1 Tax=Cytospora mali TaxID=578113 RepID=A0A194VGV4_CYTMA|nr:hypothetical protein VP1G_11498 [Valsa mali var. pyri (nom. inval.)]